MPTSPSSETAPYGGRLMFTQSWEDPACDLAALRPAPGERLLAITSGGDNVLGFLLADPGEVIAVDLNPPQNHLLELKIAAIRHLDHAGLLALLGVGGTPGARESLYRELQPHLEPASRRYWDANQAMLTRGLLTAGGFERYHAMLRAIIRLVIGRRRIEELFTLDDPAAQREFFDRRWNGPAWRALLRIGCSRAVLGRRLDPTWFTDETIPDAGGHFAGLAEHAITAIPARSNYFFAMILRGAYLDANEVPDYLRPEHHQVIRSRLDRIRIVTADISDALDREPAGSIDCMALSNAFEYSPVESFDRGRVAIRRAARTGARMAHRNLLAPRHLADDPNFEVDRDLGHALQQADRGFIYSRFEAATLGDRTS